MDRETMLDLARGFLDAWNSQEVDRVAGCYTQDVEYFDPNTRGMVNGTDALRRYLWKLFDSWRMTWELKEAFLFEGGDGCAVLWHATIRRHDGDTVIEFDGMDLVKVRGGQIERNEVYFDRTVLLPLAQNA